MFTGILIGFIVWFAVRYVMTSFYTVDQNERAVKTIFGRAERVANASTLELPIAEQLREEERERYNYPQVRVIPPGGPYFKWPWERIYKVSIATQTVNMALDPEDPQANQSGSELEAVTKDQLNTGLTGQIRYRVSEQNLYAYLFGVKRPFVHIMGYFVSVLRERIANYEAPARADDLSGGRGVPCAAQDGVAGGTSQAPTETGGARHAPTVMAAEASLVAGVSINDLRKNLRDINEHMDLECQSSAARYGMTLDASLITGIDPPPEVESALAAINTAHNQVSSDISLAQAAADQKIVQSKRAVEIETLKAQAEVQPLTQLAEQLTELKKSGPQSLPTYIRNVRLGLYGATKQVILEVKK